jgi:predicted thioredoxin/glutaredoxin
VPRISVWAYDDEQQAILTERFGTEAHRICAAEQRFLDEIRTARVYRYTFDADQFAPWELADGQYVASDVVYPVEIEVVDDLLRAHCEAGVELRLTPRLGALMDAILASSLPFSFVRIRDAQH